MPISDDPPVPVLMREVPQDYVMPERDGSLKIPRFTGLPSADCAAQSQDEIIVCAPSRNEKWRLGPVSAPPPTLMEEVGNKLRFRIGPLEIGSIDQGNGMRSGGMRIRF